MGVLVPPHPPPPSLDTPLDSYYVANKTIIHYLLNFNAFYVVVSSSDGSDSAVYCIEFIGRHDDNMLLPLLVKEPFEMRKR